MGAAFIVVLVPLALPLRFPPQGWKPAGWSECTGASTTSTDMTRAQMFRTGSFWGLWVCYILGTLAGLMAIGISSSVSQEVFELDSGTAAILIGVFAIFNGIGRPIFGSLVDRITPRNTAMISFALIFGASILLAIGAAPGAIAIYILGFSILWLCLGGWLAIAPTSTATFFGTKHYGPNYGAIFTAYGVGAIIGSLLAGNLRDIMGSYVAVFLPVAVLALAGLTIAFLFLRKPSTGIVSRGPRSR